MSSLAANLSSEIYLNVPATRTSKAALWIAVVCFSGAFLELALFGNNFRAGPSRTAVIVNSSTFLPIYMWALVAILVSWRQARRVSSVLLGHLVFASFALLSSVWAIVPIDTIREAIQLLLSVVVAIVLTMKFTPQTFLQTLARVLAFILCLSVILVYFVPSYGVMYGSEWSKLTGIPQGVFSHKNKYAEMAAVGLFVAFASKRLLSKRLFLLLLFTSVVGIAISDSLAKTSAVFIAVPFVWVLRKIARIPGGLGLSVLMSILGAVLIFLVLPQLMALFLDATGRDVTLTGRTFIWETSFKLVEQRFLLGYGFGGIWDTPLGQVDQFTTYQPKNAHNLYVEMLLRTGFLGVSLVVLILVGMFVKLLNAPVIFTPIGYFTLLLLVSLVIRSFFEVTLFRDNQIMYLLLVVSFGLSQLQRKQLVSLKAGPEAA